MARDHRTPQLQRFPGIVAFNLAECAADQSEFCKFIPQPHVGKTIGEIHLGLWGWGLPVAANLDGEAVNFLLDFGCSIWISWGKNEHLIWLLDA